MKGQPEIATLQRELEQARTTAADLRSQLEQLQLLPHVRADYDAALGQETKLKEELDRQILYLQDEKARLLNSRWSQSRPPIKPVPGNDASGQQQRFPPKQPLPLVNTRLVSEEERKARRQLEVIRRFALRLGAQDNLEMINKILSDPGQPRGALLFLVDWKAFIQPLPNETNQEKYLGRLRESLAALIEYHERLRADIDVLTLQYRGLLDIGEVWRARERDPESWNAWIAQTQAEQRKEIARLQQQKSRLEDEIRILRVQDKEWA